MKSGERDVVRNIVRQVGRSIAILSVLWGGLSQAADPLAGFTVEPVAPGHYVHYGSLDERSPDNLGDQANIGFVVGERCVAVVDPGGSLAVGKALLAALRRVTDKPVCYVVITHFHPDHFFGAAAFAGPGVEIVAHEGYRRSMGVRARPYLNALQRDLGDLAKGSDILPPTKTMANTLDLDLGGRTLKIEAWPVAHTDNDLTVFDPSTGTLWLGDLLFHQHTPVVDGSVLGFIQVLDTLAKREVTHYVPGHGKTSLPWPDGLAQERAYLTLLVRETRTALKGRRSLEEAMDSVGQSESGRWSNFESFHRRNVSATYTELEWE